jgi:hypothetical protein
MSMSMSMSIMCENKMTIFNPVVTCVPLVVAGLEL